MDVFGVSVSEKPNPIYLQKTLSASSALEKPFPGFSYRYTLVCEDISELV